MATPTMSLFILLEQSGCIRECIAVNGVHFGESNHLKSPYCVLICQRAVRGDGDGCRYVVCESCHAKRKPKGHQKSASYKESKMTSHHEFIIWWTVWSLVVQEGRDQWLELDGTSSRMCLLWGNVCGWRCMMILCLNISYL